MTRWTTTTPMLGVYWLREKGGPTSCVHVFPTAVRFASGREEPVERFRGAQWSGPLHPPEPESAQKEAPDEDAS